MSPGLHTPAPQARRGPLLQPLLASLQTLGDLPPTLAEMGFSSRGDTGGPKSTFAAPCPQG